MTDAEASLILPKRITLGNIASIATTIVSAAIVLGVLYGTFGQRLSTAEAELAKIPTTYATQAELDQLQATTKTLTSVQKEAAKETRDSLAGLADKTSATNATISGLAATMNAMQDTMTEIRRTLEERRRTTPGNAP